VHREKVYSCNREGFKGNVNTLVGSRGMIDLYCTKFINKTLSSSLPVDVSQVWAKLC